MDGILWQALISLTLIDLFAGIGGIRLGFESTGRFMTIFSSEIDRFARQTYKANFGVEPAGDIRKILAGAFPRADIVVGGTPCRRFRESGEGLVSMTCGERCSTSFFASSML